MKRKYECIGKHENDQPITGSHGIRPGFTGIQGRSCNIERAPAVTGPWSTINTQIAPASGFLEYLDINSPAAAAFYRTSAP